MTRSSDDDNGIWAALTEPLSSLVGGGQQSNEANDDDNRNRETETRSYGEIYRKRYRKRIQSLQAEVEEVNEESTKTRKQLWETQDRLKDTEDQVRQLENHLNEVLELREKDLETIKSLRAANSDCVEMESRAREAVEVFKKCYKRSQLKIKQNEEEIIVLREQRDKAERGRGRGQGETGYMDTSAMVNESALKYIQVVSNDKEKRLRKMLNQTEKEVELWKSKHKVAVKRCQNWQQHILAMEHPSEAAEHMEKQRIQIEKLEKNIIMLEEEMEMDEENKQPHVEEREDTRNVFGDVMNRAFCDDGIHDNFTTKLVNGFQNLNFPMSSMSSNEPIYII